MDVQVNDRVRIIAQPGNGIPKSMPGAIGTVVSVFPEQRASGTFTDTESPLINIAVLLDGNAEPFFMHATEVKRL